jgi:hypothetical protein
MQNLFDQQSHEPRKRIKNAASSEEKETVDETQLLSLKVEKTKNDYNKYYGEKIKNESYILLLLMIISYGRGRIYINI